MRRPLRALLALALFLLAWAALRGIAGPDVGLATLAPAFVLLVPLLAGRYVGADALERLQTARAVPPPRRDAGRAPHRPRRTPLVGVPRGGLLLAASLATRPPPLLG